MKMTDEQKKQLREVADKVAETVNRVTKELRTRKKDSPVSAILVEPSEAKHGPK